MLQFGLTAVFVLSDSDQSFVPRKFVVMCLNHPAALSDYQVEMWSDR